jgi:hypothetical protein
MKTFALSLTLGLMIAGTAWAEEAAPGAAGCEQTAACGAPNCCGHCGCRCGCEKYCTVVCEMKEVKKVVWEVKCEEFCPMLPGCASHCCAQCGNTCESLVGGKCAACCNCDPCALENSKHYVTPKSGHMRCRQILVKKEVVCKVPVYKSVVQYLCGGCGGEQTAPGAAPAPAPAPPAPKPAPAPEAPKAASVIPLPSIDASVQLN